MVAPRVELWFDNATFVTPQDPPLRVPGVASRLIHVDSLTRIPFLHQDSPTRVFKHIPSAFANDTLKAGVAKLGSLLHYRKLESVNRDRERGDKEEGLHTQNQAITFARSDETGWLGDPRHQMLTSPILTHPAPQRVTYTDCVAQLRADVADRCLVYCASTDPSPEVGQRMAAVTTAMDNSPFAVLEINNNSAVWIQLALAAIEQVRVEPQAVIAARVVYGEREEWSQGRSAPRSDVYPAFLKPSHQRHQSEFRLAVVFKRPVEVDSLLVRCSSLTKHARPIPG